MPSIACASQYIGLLVSLESSFRLSSKMKLVPWPTVCGLKCTTYTMCTTCSNTSYHRVELLLAQAIERVRLLFFRYPAALWAIHSDIVRFNSSKADSIVPGEPVDMLANGIQQLYSPARRIQSFRCESHRSQLVSYLFGTHLERFSALFENCVHRRSNLFYM